jgi:hypothetical protein
MGDFMTLEEYAERIIGPSVESIAEEYRRSPEFQWYLRTVEAEYWDFLASGID